MIDHLRLLGRETPLFSDDLKARDQELNDRIRNSRILVVGGAGSIGSAVVKQIFKRRPKSLHVIDIAENNLAELVRDLRSSVGYIDGDFAAYCIDLLGPEFDSLIMAQSEPYDMVMQFAALKHVRSEKDPFTLMRMIRVNVLGTQRLVQRAVETGVKHVFALSTDKAASPINAMGATKRLMEAVLHDGSREVSVSSARFANVLFSDGSLPYAWDKRISKSQPIVAPNDVFRYFVTHDEAAGLCLMAAMTANNREVYFPKPTPRMHEIAFSELAKRYLAARGLEPSVCESEDDAREIARQISGLSSNWPCYFFGSDTTGEKTSEEFYEPDDDLDLERFGDIGIVRQQSLAAGDALSEFVDGIRAYSQAGRWTKPDLLNLVQRSLHSFTHTERGRSLDDRM